MRMRDAGGTRNPPYWVFLRTASRWAAGEEARNRRRRVFSAESR
jgi:hypothetical protein